MSGVSQSEEVVDLTEVLPEDPGPSSSSNPSLCENSPNFATTNLNHGQQHAPTLPPGGAGPCKKAKTAPKVPTGALSDHLDAFREVREWDPFKKGKKDSYLSPVAHSRLKKDIKQLYHDMPFGIFIDPEEKDVSLIHALIIGPFDTPYEGGFFHFALRFPDDYPMSPPKVKLMTTHGGRVRFNPNLYSCGKVCLSTLGTWSGPPWTACQTLSTVLVSIQSLLNEKPYYNEPGFDTERSPGASAEYNNMLSYLTLSVAVALNVDNKQLPHTFRTVISDSWPMYYENTYMRAIERLRPLKGKTYSDPFGGTARGTYKIDELEKKLKELNERFASNADGSSGTSAVGRNNGAPEPELPTASSEEPLV